MTEREVLRLALEALEKADKISGHPNNKKTITAIKAALEQPEPEPAAKYSDIVSDGGFDPRNKFDTPPKREWQGLTDEERSFIRGDYLGYDAQAKAIEAKLKEKNS